jgi:glycosyltransferase involved in cell wall biosynthesis
MRVAVVTTSYPAHAGDPAGHFVKAEVDHLVSEGQRVTVLAPGARPNSGNPEVIGLVGGSAFGWPGALPRLRERPMRLLAACGFMAAAAAKLRSGDFERVIAHWVVPCAWPIALATRAPLEVVAHGSDVRLLVNFPVWLRMRIVSDLLERGARFRFVARSLQRELVEATTLELAEHSSVQPCPILMPAMPGREQARLALEIRADERVIAIVGRLIASKRTQVALSAARLLSAKCIVIGDGPERQALERSFPEARFTGQLTRPETLLWLRAADLLLTASLKEGAPTVIREARALGLAVVAVDTADLKHWAQDDSGIVLVDAGASDCLDRGSGEVGDDSSPIAFQPAHRYRTSRFR